MDEPTSGLDASQAQQVMETLKALAQEGHTVRENTRTATQKVANRNVRDFGWKIAHAAVSRRPPISL